MKRILLLTAAAFILSSVNAQFRRPESTAVPSRPEVQVIKPQAKMEAAQMRLPGSPVVKAPKQADDIKVWYNRPAGAYPASIVVVDSASYGMCFAPYLAITPYVDYTFIANAVGVSEYVTFEWGVQHWGNNDDYGDEPGWLWIRNDKILTCRWGCERVEVPILYWDDGENYGSYQYASRRGGDPGSTTQEPSYIANILSLPNTMDIWECDLLKSSKTFRVFDDNGDYLSPMTYISGANPHGDNKSGWWFGKNGGTTVESTGYTYRIDGIAQAYEKPTAPYLLKQVVLDCAVLEVAAPVEMTCKVYKLDGIPAYNDSVSVTLPEEPGELIAKGHATVTPETYEAAGGLVFFTLYGEDYGLEIDIAPTIDCAILVVIDGYNEPEMADLLDFTASISSDMHVDEGFGELAYLKFGIMDENGNLDHYVWTGLNHFFGGDDNEMMTGLSIFLSTENPYLVLYYDEDVAEYIFPPEGGTMVKMIGDQACPGIRFGSWEPSADDAWNVTCNGEDVPDWLTITLEDKMVDGEFTGVVNAEVTAEPLPHGVKYREAVVRFEYPGTYLDYKFMQKANPLPPRPTNYDWNGDGCVNVSDVNFLIDLILTGDGEYNIADLNALIAYILGLQPIW